MDGQSVEIAHLEENKGVSQNWNLEKLASTVLEDDIIEQPASEEAGSPLSSSTELTEEASGKKEEKKFRIHAKQLFLTYPQFIEWKVIEITEQETKILEEIRQQLEKKALERGCIVEKYILSLEYHEEKGTHVHVYLSLNRKISISDPNGLDLKREEKVYHGNYQGVKNKNAVIGYVLKEEKYITNMKIRGGKEMTFRDELVYKLREEGLEEALDMLDSSEDSKLITNEYSKIKHNLISLNKRIRPEYAESNYSIMDFNFPAAVVNWWIYLSSTKTLVLTGPPGTGKTEGMLALLGAWSPLRVTEKNRLKDIPEICEAIILDDISVEEFTREELIHLMDVKHSGSIRVLWGVANIKKGIMRAWVGNEFIPAGSLPKEIARRIERIHVEDNWFGYEEIDWEFTGRKIIKTPDGDVYRVLYLKRGFYKFLPLNPQLNICKKLENLGGCYGDFYIIVGIEIMELYEEEFRKLDKKAREVYGEIGVQTGSVVNI